MSERAVASGRERASERSKNTFSPFERAQVSERASEESKHVALRARERAPTKKLFFFFSFLRASERAKGRGRFLSSFERAATSASETSWIHVPSFERERAKSKKHSTFFIVQRPEKREGKKLPKNNAPGRARRASRRPRRGAGRQARCGCRYRRRPGCGRAS